ncbi:predicted protein [Arabidopsis lyrata subsp. lyrata]|uniref:Predicted protein n=1 Tax=Arabidopsis lyrata subsp. lyrata TaxID=81972 RepID=D7LJN8_ARALL|nr:predicted protein [Arabidopsis lyrata subsp. lyrata]
MSQVDFSESISDCTRYLNGEKRIDEIVDYTSSCTSWETDTDTDTEKEEESNVLLVQPHGEAASSEKLFHTSSSVSDCTNLLDGGSIMDQSVSSQGDKNARFYRMIHDIQLWKIDTLPLRYPTESTVIVISNNIPGDIDFIECLNCSASRGYNNLLVQPNEAAPEKPETSE